MIIYHGSTNNTLKPSLKQAKKENDFGRGFYCTEEIEKAKEWACINNEDGFVYKFYLNMNNLKVLDLTSNSYNVLNWITLLINNRDINSSETTFNQTKRYLNDNYYIDTSIYDVIIGYRADDSYFSYARSFISNSLSIEDLESLLLYGDLGKQVVLVSEKAFENLKYISKEQVNKDIYYKKFYKRDDDARSKYKREFGNKTIDINKTYIIDLIRGNK